MIRIQEGETKHEGEKLPKVEEAAESQATQEIVGIVMKFLIITRPHAPSQKLTKEMAADLSANTQEEEATQGRREEQTKEARPLECLRDSGEMNLWWS